MTFPLFRPESGAAAPARLFHPQNLEPPAVSDFTVDLNNPPVHTMPADLKAAYDKFEPAKEALINKFLGLYSGTEQTRLKQLLTNHTTRPFLLVQRDLKTAQYSPYLSIRGLNSSPIPFICGRIVRSPPCIMKWGTILHHILIGDSAFLGLKTRGTIFTGHDLGYTGAASTLIEEPAYFTQYFATYTKVDRGGDWLRSQLGNRAPTANYPDIEGFTCHLLTQLIRRAQHHTVHSIQR